MTELTLSKNIPLPEPGYGARSKVGLAVSKMKVGDSFVLPKGFKITALHRYGHFHGVKLTARKQPNGQHRVWRKP